MLLTRSIFNLNHVRINCRHLSRHIKKSKVKSSDNQCLLKPRQLWRPVVVTITVTGISFTSAIIIDYENFRLTSDLLPESFHQLRRKYDFINKMYLTWNRLNSCEKIFVGVCAFNLLICLGLKTIPNRLCPYFVSQARTKNLFPSMILHIFSHSSLLHLAVNMYVLYSCLSMVNFHLGANQSWALYLSAGVFASLASIVHKSIRRIHQPSIGASGAILGLLAASCMINPEASLGIVFIPNLLIPAKYGICGIIALDTMGIIRQWRLFDHAAHLGGTIFGIWYIKYGQELIWRQRTRLLRVYLDLKKRL
ncbi:presenilins-associated rhomboid-like protein, mitochondrial [Panonychus citri]|uniref:presenilins-associated rhomboid-like protein, mitochondrial n=1 Tax=Panonychus citri TaxID=50023 RepID=UPI0023082F2D|nr:presenilins-associated rhomboid-like protein, mitochondrial [Panonychus citri]